MAHTKVTKTYSQNTGAANTFSYSGSFDVFKGTEVVALLDNVKLTYTASTINESASPREYTVDTTAKTIHIGGADLSSGVIIIRPETDMGDPTPRATYTPGASITSADLNNNQTQLLRKALEYDDQKLASTGGTMTGDLTMGEDTTLIFEGATDDGYETTVTVTDPTADRTITIPNVTGTLITTGDTGTVAHAMIAGDAVDGDNIGDDVINSEHIAAGAIDLEHMASSSVDSDNIVNDTIVNADINSAAAIAHSKLANVTSGQILVGNGSNVPTAVAVSGDVTLSNAGAVTIATGAVEHAMLAADCIDGDNIQDDVLNSEHYAAASIDHEHLANDCVDGDNIADNAIDSEHYTDGSIDNAHIADTTIASGKLAGSIAHSKLANVTDGQILVGNGSNVPTAVAVSGDVTIANTGAVTIANDAVEIAMIGCEQTTISDSDSHLPTSGAVVDYVTAQIAPIGGLEVVATDAAFPNTQPASGVVISIADAGGLVVNGSDTSTTGRTVGGSTVTVNNINSQFRSTTVADGVGMLVTSTGSGHIYNYHKATLKEADLINLSTDINDFGNRYRVNAGEPGSNNDEGDLVYDTNANKMKVYDSSTSAWKEVTSTGDFKFLVPVDAGTTTAASWDGSDTSFDLKETTNSGSAASVTNINQLIVSLNGVIQKPNTGSYSSSEEGFYLTDADTIRFCTAPPSGSTAFIIQCGSAVSIPTPGDGTVSAAKIAAGAVIAAKIGADAVDGTKLADNACDSEHYTDGSIDHVHLANDCVDGDNLADNACNSEHYTDGSIDHVHLAADCVDGDNIQDDVINSEHIAAGAVDLEHMSSESVDEDNLHISNAGSNGQFLSKQSGNAGGLTWATATGTDTQNFRNLLINGDMTINQRYGMSGHVTGLTNGAAQYGADRWELKITNPSGSTWSYNHSDTAPESAGFRKSIQCANTATAQATPAAETLIYFRQQVEAKNAVRLAWGTGSAKQLTVSFWVRCDVTGTGQVNIQHMDGSNRVSGQYTISSAGTWEHKTITFPASAEEINNDTGPAFRIEWIISAGADAKTGTLRTTWTSPAEGDRAAGHSLNICATVGHKFSLTGVQLEEGDTATDFERVDYGTNMARCQRYYTTLLRYNGGETGDGNAQLSIGYNESSSVIIGCAQLPVHMRATPDLDHTSGTDYWEYRAGGTTTTISSAMQASSQNNTSFGYAFTGASGLTSGQAGRFQRKQDNIVARRFAADAEY